MFALAIQSPVLSSFLLIVAGILVGYALSYPYRGESQDVLDELNDLRKENGDLQHSIRTQESALSLADLGGDQQELLETTEGELATARDQITQLQLQIHESQDQLTDVNREAAELRGEVNELNLVKEQQLNHSGDDLRRLELTIESLTKRMYEIEEERNDIASQLNNERDQRQALDESLREKEQLIGQHDAGSLQDVQEHLAQTQTSLEQTTAKLQRAMAERDEAVAVAETREEELFNVSRDRDDHFRALETIERLRAGSESEVASFQDQASDYESRLIQTEVLLDQAQAEMENHQQARIKSDHEREYAIAELDATRQRSLHLESEVSRLQHETDRIRGQREEVLASLRVEQDRSAQMQKKTDHHVVALADKERELQLASEQMRSLQPVSDEFALVQQKLESTSSRLQNLKHEHHEALQAKARIEAIVAEMREELRKNSDLITATRSARDDRAIQLERELENERRIVSELRPTIAELQQKLTQQEERISSANEQEFEMTTLYTQLSDMRHRLDHQHTETINLREDLAAKVEMMAHLELERDEAVAQTRRASVTKPEYYAEFDASHSARSTTQSTRPSGIHAATASRRDERRGMIFTRPPAVQDDLKRISGVAEKLEQRLNDFGIYTYEQIMNWDSEVVEEFGRLLAFKDRIVRDDWVGQASQLHQEAYPQKRSA